MKSVPTFFAILWATVVLHAGDRYFAPNATEFIPLHSDQTGHDYELLVALPGSYHSSPDRSYPTVYMMDAQWDFALVCSIVDKLSYDNALSQIIIVGITYAGDDPNYGDLRERDLTPSRVEDVNPNSGDAEKFLQFIEEGIIPSIESRYRADPQYRALGGSSYGALFSMYALYQKPGLFGRHIANSPSGTWDDGYLYRLDNAHAKKSNALPARLAIAHGGDEYSVYRDLTNGLQNKIAGRGYEGLELLSWEVEGGRHASASIEGWTRGLRWVFQDIAPTEPEPLEAGMKALDYPFKVVE